MECAVGFRNASESEAKGDATQDSLFTVTSYQFMFKVLVIGERIRQGSNHVVCLEQRSLSGQHQRKDLQQ